MSVSPPTDDYFLEIESHFAQRRNTPFILSAKDWALMKKWREEGVPLPVVIEAIDQVFERNETSGRRKVISSLSYCRHAVKELWEERRELQICDGEPVPEENAAELLEALAADVELSQAPAALASSTATEVRALEREKSVPRIEELLIDLERRMDEQILAVLPPDERTAIETTAAAALGATRLDEKTRQRTLEANRRRIIRERFSLPRLTLFR